MESIEYGGWRCARLVSGNVEAIVTLDVGPRVIRLAAIEGPNELNENEKDRGKKGGSDYRSYGGHRLWIAPENERTTLEPENEPVEQEEDEDWLVVRPWPDRWHLQKEIRIRPAGEGGFQLVHRIHNQGGYEVELAPWALTVMAPGGECLFPQEPHEPHSENFLPVRPLVLWSYTDMSDPRWTWGRRVVRLRQDAQGGPQKVGALLRGGYAAYCNHGNTFVKVFPHIEEAAYPDFDCNFETFTRQDMLEVESLGPFQIIEPGGYAEHLESWRLFLNEAPPADEDECAEWLFGLASRCPELA
jgi:hypothetical protein